MKTIKRTVLGLVAVAGIAAAALSGGTAEARYQVSVMETECPPGYHLQPVANPSLPGYPAYCTFN